MPANGRWDLIRRLKVKHNVLHPRVVIYICYKYVVYHMPSMLKWADIVYFKRVCLRGCLFQYRNCEHYLSDSCHSKPDVPQSLDCRLSDKWHLAVCHRNGHKHPANWRQFLCCVYSFKFGLWPSRFPTSWRCRQKFKHCKMVSLQTIKYKEHLNTPGVTIE